MFYITRALHCLTSKSANQYIFIYKYKYTHYTSRLGPGPQWGMVFLDYYYDYYYHYDYYYYCDYLFYLIVVVSYVCLCS